LPQAVPSLPWTLPKDEVMQCSDGSKVGEDAGAQLGGAVKSTPYGCFLKWWVSPTTMGFPTKNDHFRVFTPSVLFFRQLKTPKTSNSCLKKRALSNFRFFFGVGGPSFLQGSLKLTIFQGIKQCEGMVNSRGFPFLIVHCLGLIM